MLKSSDSCKHAFVMPQLPYRGLLKILKSQPKYHNICVKNVDQNISLDGLKPAFLNATQLYVDIPLIFHPM